MTGHKQPDAVRRLITCRTCRIVKVSTATALTNPTIRRPFPFERITPGTLPCSIVRRQIRMFIIDVNVFYEGAKSASSSGEVPGSVRLRCQLTVSCAII